MKCKYENQLNNIGFCKTASMYCTFTQKAHCKRKVVEKTNADRIRCMTDEELTALIVKWQKEDPVRNWCKDEFGCMDLGENFDCTDALESKCIVRWLRQPAE